MENVVVGFWGEPTATVDWCEKNYDVTHYIAEFFNTVSSLCMVCVGIFGVFMHTKGFETRFPICFASVIVVGIGSILFHGTLLFSLQLFDEVPMMFCALILCYSVIENKKERKFGNWFPIGLIIWGMFITIVMVLSGRYHQDKMMQLVEFYVFQGTFILMAACVYLHTVVIVMDPSSEQSIRRLWLLGSVVFLIGYIGWHLDLHFCSNMNQLPFDAPNPQLHAWWHLTASYGSYLICVLVTYDRSKVMDKAPQIRWILHILPYVELPSTISIDEKSPFCGSQDYRKIKYGAIKSDDDITEKNIHIGAFNTTTSFNNSIITKNNATSKSSKYSKTKSKKSKSTKLSKSKNKFGLKNTSFLCKGNGGNSSSSSDE